MILAPPDTEGVLAAAALERAYGMKEDVQFLWSHEVSRRVSALADEPTPVAPIVVDLVPTNSVQSLLIPALDRLIERDARATWFYGRETPAPSLLALEELMDLVYEEGMPAWRLALRRRKDAEFAALAEQIEDESTDQGRAWRLLLRAVATSWDWPRIYSSLRALAELRAVQDVALEWARSQLAEVERTEVLVREAPVRDVRAKRLAVVTDPTIPARVRPEVLRGIRTDVDAIAFVAGPSRLVVLTTQSGDDLRFLVDLEQDPAVTVGSLAGPRVDVAWKGGSIPQAVVDVVGEEAFRDAAHAPAAHDVAEVVHRNGERMAKGMDASRMPMRDRAVVSDVLADLENERDG